MRMDEDEDERDLDYAAEFSTAALEWLAAKNKAWFDAKGNDAVYYINHDEGKIYFYKSCKDYPDKPRVWYTGEAVGTWSPNSSTFMWSCDNKTAPGMSNDVSKAGKQWFAGNAGFSGSFMSGVNSLDEAWRIAAIAARLANVEAVYNSPSTFNDVKDELAAVGRKVPVLGRNKVYNHGFFAVTGKKKNAPTA